MNALSSIRETERLSSTLDRRPDKCVCLICVHDFLSLRLLKTYNRFREPSPSLSIDGAAIYAPCPSWARPQPGRTQEANNWKPLMMERRWSFSDVKLSWVFSSFHLDTNYYKCPEDQCRSKYKDFKGMLRHYQAKHCAKPPRYPCNVFNCKYSADNGFLRKDKLKSHYQKVHAGQAVWSNTSRRLLPAPAKTVSPSTGHESSNANSVADC